MWPDFKEDQDIETFKENFLQFSTSLPDFYVAACQVSRDEWRPVGVLISRNGGQHPAIHALWFKWATARQILECSSKYLCLLRDEHTMGFVQHEVENRQYDRFFDHLTDVGLLRRVGMVKHFHEKDKDVRLYQMTRKL